MKSSALLGIFCFLPDFISTNRCFSRKCLCHTFMSLCICLCCCECLFLFLPIPKASNPTLPVLSRVPQLLLLQSHTANSFSSLRETSRLLLSSSFCLGFFSSFFIHRSPSSCSCQGSFLRDFPPSI